MDLPSLATTAHLWVVAADAPPDSETGLRFLQMLSFDERARFEQFHFARDRQRFLLSHALVRSVLSYYCKLPPRDWHFTEGSGIRPEIANVVGTNLELRFNLTHTRGLVACVVTREADCGVDAEDCHSLQDLTELANYTLHPRELQAFSGISEPNRLDSFLSFWTAKEACMKACGRGLTLVPNSFALAISNDSLSARVLEAPDGLNWRITLLRPTPMHHLAVALDSFGPQQIAVQYLPADLSPLFANDLASGP